MAKDSISKLNKQSPSTSLINMKKEELKEWKKCFNEVGGKLIRPCDERLSAAIQKNEPSLFFCFTANYLEGSFPKIQVSF